MIYIEITYLNPTNFMPMSTLNKTFMHPGEFHEFYKLAKIDPCMVLNIMTYDPHTESSRKAVYDSRLLNLARINPV